MANWVWVTLGLGLIGTLMACTSEPVRKPDLELLDSPEQLDAEARRLRDLQLVRVLDPDSKPVVWGTDVLLEVLAGQCGLGSGDAICLNEHPRRATRRAELLDNNQETDGEEINEPARVAECGMLARECYARSLLAAVQNPDSVALVRNNVQYRLVPQSTATNAGLAEQAVAEFTTAMKWWTTLFLGGGVTRANGIPLGSPTVADAFEKAERVGWRFLEYYHLAREALDLAIENTVAAADAQLVSHSRLYQARKISGAALSRVAAARMLVGSDFPGLLGSTTEPFCTGSRLSGPAARARDILRSAGPSPRDVTTPQLKIREFLESTTNGSTTDLTKPQDGSIRKRLEDFWDVTLPGNQPLTSVFGLTEQDFAEARAALAAEIRVFGRSQVAALAVEKRSDAHQIEHTKFAGTATLPPDRDQAFWQEVLWDNNGQDYRTKSNTAAGEPGYLEPIDDLAHLVDYAQTMAARVLTRPAFQLPEVGTPLTSDQAALKSHVLDPLGLLAISTERPARVVRCVENPSAPGEEMKDVVVVQGVGDDEGVVLVEGHDAMECATRGSVESAPCSLVTTVPSGGLVSGMFRIYPIDTPEGSPREFTKAANRTFQQGELVRPFPTVWYVLRPRTAGIPRPGGYVSMLGFRAKAWVEPSQNIPGARECRFFPVVPQASERVKKVLAPSRAWCGEQQISCDGTPFDARMPLEDELSEDGNDVESSWRHYLTLARTAATHADRLGVEYLDSNLTADLEERDESLRRLAQQEKALGEIDSLQQICGTAVDPVAILSQLGVTNGVFDLNAITSGECMGTAGEFCLGDRAVKDWRTLFDNPGEDPELARLAECIAQTGATMPFVHLGDGMLCLQASGVTELSRLRGEKNEDYYARCTDECKTGMVSGACLGPEEGIGLFVTEEAPAPTEANEIAERAAVFCDTIRRVRETTADATDELSQRYENMVKTRFLDSQSLAKAAEALAMGIEYGDFITVKGPNVHWTTEQMEIAEEDRTWPCAPADVDCSNQAALFCESIDCDVASERSYFNDRLYRAVVAAKVTTWKDGMEAPIFEAPHYVDHRLLADASLDPAAINFLGAPIGVTANGSWRVFDSLETGVAARGTSIGSPGDPLLVRRENGDRLAFGRFALQPERDWSTFFYGGLSTGNTPGIGYLEAKFRGLPLPSLGQFTPVQVGMPFVACNNVGPETFAGIPTRPYSSNRTVNVWVGSGETGSIGISNQNLNASLTCLGLAPALGTSSLPISNDNETCGWFGLSCSHDAVLVRLAEHVGVIFSGEEEELLDGIELLCEARRAELAGDVKCNEPPKQIRGPEDLPALAGFFDCTAEQVEAIARQAIFADFPQAAFDPLRKNASGPYSSAPGDLQRHLSLLKEALAQVAKSGPVLSGAVRRYGSLLRQLRAALVQYDTQQQIDSIRFQAEGAAQGAACFERELRGIVGLVSGDASGLLGALVGCTAAMDQIAFATALRAVGSEQNQAEREGAIASFEERFSGVQETLQEEALNLAQALETVGRELGEIRSLKQAAARSVEKALWLLSAQAANQTEITNFLENRSVGSRIRYQAALKNAKHLAFLAKRAIEQRLGHDFSDMVQDLPLVDAPAGWASSVCSMTGLSYDTLTTADQVQNFTDGFIGDYVIKLENVVESYRLAHNFHEGSDTLVASLRDDVFGTRAACDTESRNLFYQASRLDLTDRSNRQSRLGWYFDGCQSSVDGLRLLPNCVAVDRRPDGPFFHSALGGSPASGFELRFAGGDGCFSATECGWAAGAGVAQAQLLSPGRYRFSWYTAEGAGSGGWLAAHVKFADGTSPVLDVIEIDPPGEVGDWHRIYAVFDVPDEQVVTFSFQRPSATSFIATIAAPMLEKLGDPFLTASGSNPQVFWDTTTTRMSSLPVCQDTDGSAFRATNWQRECIKLCRNGYASNCAGQAVTECYRQATFHLSQREIEAGFLFKHSGFARGNFNYRIESVGLNFVGTSLHACEGSPLPSTCYAAGYVPYSLTHEGPYYVRNEQGLDFTARLFTGQIEHARGLATERYLTNPLSDTDKSLLGDFLRYELRGRPLDGTFVLRVWEAPGFNFDAIEDIQLVLKYRYWTRFN